MILTRELFILLSIMIACCVIRGEVFTRTGKHFADSWWIQIIGFAFCNFSYGNRMEFHMLLLDKFRGKNIGIMINLEKKIIIAYDCPKRLKISAAQRLFECSLKLWCIKNLHPRRTLISMTEPLSSRYSELQLLQIHEFVLFLSSYPAERCKFVNLQPL